MNNFSCTGNLGKDPEMRYMESGKVVTKFPIAVRSGKINETLWLDVELWDKSAEIAGEYCKKGSKVGIVGKLAEDKWEKDGKEYKKTVIKASQIILLDKKED